jgi:hypothetical protein
MGAEIGAMPRHPNHVRTERKQVCLTPEGRALIQAWAQQEGISFSAAIETLARVGLQQDPRDAWGPALAAKVVGAVRADLGRYRALLAATALDAGTTLRIAAAGTKVLRPKEYPDIKRLARLEAIAALRRRDALAELGLPDDVPPAGTPPEDDPDAAPAGALPTEPAGAA